MKKVAILLSLMLSVVFVQSAKAEDQQVLAIIDTAIDSNYVPNVIYELCFTLDNTCPNKTNFQEGRGSAAVKDWTIKGVDHGYNVTQVALRTNPNLKIVFIRISDEKVYDTFSMIRNDGGSLARAVDWISKNADKYSIDAISISQSRSNFATGTCPNDKLLSDSVVSLNAKNIPTFVATGNDKKKDQVGYPACVDGVIGVGGLAFDKKSSTYVMAPITNVGPGLDVLAVGDDRIRPYLSYIRNLPTWIVDLSGTSIATPKIAAYYVNKKNSGNWNDIVSLLPKWGIYPYLSN